MPKTREIKSDKKISLPFIQDEKLSYYHPDGNFSVSYQFLTEELVYIENSGDLDLEFSKRTIAIMAYIEEAFKKENKTNAFYFISDIQKVKHFPFESSRIVKNYVDEQLANGKIKHIAIVSNDLMIRLYVKSSNFLRKVKINSIHSDINSAEEYINDLIIKKEKDDKKSNLKVKKRPKETDQEKIVRLELENKNLKVELKSQIDDITDKIKSISTKRNFDALEFKNTKNPYLAPIHQALNFLNLDIQLILSNLERANKSLEENISKSVNQNVFIEKRLQSVMDFSSDFICMVDTDYNIEFINPSFQNYLKALYQVEINEGEKWNEFLPEKAKKVIYEILREANLHGEGRKYVKAKNIHIDFTATVLVEDDKINGYLVIGRNISELTRTLNQLIKSKENYKFITDNINDVIWTHDKNTKINFVSASIHRQRGFTIDEFKNLDLEHVMAIDSAKKLQNIIDTKEYLNYSQNNPLVFTAEYFNRDGSIMHGESHAYPIFENGIFKSIFGITKNVSDKIENLNRIEQQNSELESILNNTDEQIISLNKNLEYVTMNEVARNFVRSNFNVEPQMGESIMNYMSDANRNKILVAFRKVLKGENYHYIFRYPKDGKLQYLDSRFRPIFIKNEVFGISIFIKDISKIIYTQIELRVNEQRLKRITHNTLDGVWEYSYSNKDLYLSPRLRELVGYNGDDKMLEFSRYIKSIMDNQDYESLATSVLNHLVKNNSFELATKIKLDGKNDKWLLIRASISKNSKEEPQTISGVLIDVSPQKLQEEELKKAKEKAEEMMLLKSNFLANMSHEVRTPLNGILGVTQLLEEEDLPEEIQYYLAMQKESGHRLLNTINNILSVSRLDSTRGDEELKPIELNAFIKNNIEPFKILAKQKNIELHFKPYKGALMIPMNEHLFYQVFNNLVGNALKFTMKGKIVITTDRDADHAILHVEDTGIGISSEFLENIFEAFEQESTGINRNFEGSGLGLAIVKRYLDKIGGDIKIDSKKNKGTKFTLLLPLQEVKSEKQIL